MKIMGKLMVSNILQIIILILALLCTIVNSWQYEFPRILLPFIFQLEAVATTFIFMVYIITLIIKAPENIFLLLMLVSLFHGIVFLAVSIAMLLTFSGNAIMGFESDVWDNVEKILLLISGGAGIVTSVVLIAEAVLCLVGHISNKSKKVDA